MATVYLVSQGCYSDYHIVGVYSTREGAEALAAYYNGPPGGEPSYSEGARVEKYEMDQPIPQEYRGWLASGVIGNPMSPWVRWGEWDHEENANVHYQPDNWYVTVRAETEEKARLLWADIRRAILAGTIVAEPEASNG